MVAIFHVRPHVSDSGTCDVSIGSVSLTISVLVGADGQGHATLSTTGCSLSIGKLDIHFHGGARYELYGKADFCTRLYHV